MVACQTIGEMALLRSEIRNKLVIFVVGTSRSGKTLVSRILGNSPRIFTYRELHFFERLYQPDKQEAQLAEPTAAKLYGKLLETQEKGILGSAQANEFLKEATRCVGRLDLRDCSAIDVYRSFLHEYAGAQKFGAIPCEQTGSNIFYMDEILCAFPNARIVNMVRDPRDVLIAKREKWKFSKKTFNRIPLKELIRQSFQYHPYIVSKLWLANVRAAAKFKDNPSILTVHLEDLLDNPEHFVRKICDLVEIEYSSELLRFGDDAELASGPGNHCTRLTIRSADIRKNSNRISSTELYICQRVTAAELVECGYQTHKIVPSHLMLAWYSIILPLKLFLALVVNMKRVGGLRAAVFRRIRGSFKDQHFR